MDIVADYSNCPDEFAYARAKCEADDIMEYIALPPHKTSCHLTFNNTEEMTVNMYNRNISSCMPKSCPSNPNIADLAFGNEQSLLCANCGIDIATCTTVYHVMEYGSELEAPSASIADETQKEKESGATTTTSRVSSTTFVGFVTAVMALL